ncbi:uncharacterized protein [Diadema antillarum]|uniref:uncharacterized protein n=1 Tax=Diadema antillarum TaxID=105358 RepID=UPI003A872853
MAVSESTPLDSLELLSVAENLGPYAWRKLGLYLGLTEVRLANWERQFHMNTEQAAHQMLITWNNSQDEEKGRRLLMAALESCKLRNLSDKVQNGAFRARLPDGMKPVQTAEANSFAHQVPHPQQAHRQPPQAYPQPPQQTAQPAPIAGGGGGDHLQMELSEILLCDVAMKLGAEWRFVGTYLGFLNSEIEILQQQHNLVSECIFQMLLQWRKKNGVNATKAKLKKALEKAGRSDLSLYVDNPDD